MGRLVGSVRIPYVVQDVDRHGNVRTYVRLPRQPKIRLRHPIGSPEFWAEYNAATAREPIVTGPATGTFAALCEAYYASATFERFDVSTQSWRRRALDRLRKEHGDKPVSLLQPRHVRDFRNELESQPIVANQRLKALKALFRWAIDHGEADRDPTREIGALRIDSRGHHSWTIEEVERYEARHARGTKARLAMALLLYTAGRREDAVRLGPANIVAGRVVFTQAKNEHRKPVDIDVPLHPDLAATIAATKLTGTDTFLVTDYGSPYTPAGFGNWFRDRCIEAGVPGRAHGLRKALLTRLANEGASAHEIMSWSGHATLEEAEHYTRAANRRRLADSGLAKLVAGTPREQP